MQDKSLAFRLKLSTQHPPVLCMQPWVFDFCSNPAAHPGFMLLCLMS
jgi:hypothetical protein